MKNYEPWPAAENASAELAALALRAFGGALLWLSVMALIVFALSVAL